MFYRLLCYYVEKFCGVEGSVGCVEEPLLLCSVVRGQQGPESELHGHDTPAQHLLQSACHCDLSWQHTCRVVALGPAISGLGLGAMCLPVLIPQLHVGLQHLMAETT